MQCPATPLLLMIVRASSRKSSRKRSWFHIQSGNKFYQLVTFMQDSLKAMTDISLNPFFLNASFHYPLNRSENLSEGREREFIGNKWVKVQKIRTYLGPCQRFMMKEFAILIAAWKVSIFRVFLVLIFPHLDWIRRDTPYLLRLIAFYRCAQLFLCKNPLT